MQHPNPQAILHKKSHKNHFFSYLFFTITIFSFAIFKASSLFTFNHLHFLLVSNIFFFMELKSSSQLHSVSTFDQTVDLNNHLFSSIVALYILIFLYFPTLFLNIVFSPVFVSTGVLLVYLLRLGAKQDTRKELYSAETLQSNDSSDKIKQNQAHSTEEGRMYADVMSCTKNTELSSDETYTWESCDFKFENVENSFIEWNVKAPLEIIYEDDEEEDDDGDDHKSENRFKAIERYPSLSLCYPESDTDCSSDDDFAMDMNWESMESSTFRWAEKGEELIEIALDGKTRSQFFNDEEDSLIEIDISPGRNNEFAGQY